EHPSADLALQRGEPVAAVIERGLGGRPEVECMLLPLEASGSRPGALLCVDAARAPTPAPGAIELLRRLCGAEYGLRWELAELEALRQISAQTLSNALHDFGAPIAALCACAKDILSEYAGEANDSRRKLLDSLARSSGRLAFLHFTLGRALGG